MTVTRREFNRWAYGLCQLAGWGLYASTNAVMFAARGLSSPGVMGLVVVNAAVGLGLTHGLRALVHRQRWATLPVRALAPRVLAASVGLAVVTQSISFVLAVGVVRLYPLEQASALAFVFYVAQSSILFLLWQVLYFGIHAVQRSRRAELERLASVAAAQTAELRALRGQLNPHFLFNSLNTLRGLIAEDPAKAQEAVTRLSGLLRYALGSGEAQTVTLERELEVVNDYLALEALRLEERLSVAIDVPPELRAMPVPVMLVQTLVENAVKHGIAPRPEGGALKLSAGREASTWWLKVTNPAPGAGATRPVSTGVGLANARERLRLLFGEAASLSLDANGPVTTAQVVIPCR